MENENLIPEEEEEMGNIIELTDEEGNEVSFEVLDVIEDEGIEYAVVLPLDDENDEEVVILEIQVSEDGEDENYLGVDDEALLVKIFDLFKERNSELFDFAD